MSNYNEATRLANVDPSDWSQPTLIKANALATLALVDELKAGRDPQVKEVYILQQYRPDQDREGLILDVYKDRDFAYLERDRLNESAHNMDAAIRYIIKEKSVK
jgi:hypothetical protein